MHKFSTVAPKPSALTAFRSLGLLDVLYSTPAVPSVARLVRTAFSAPRYENLCIIRAIEKVYPACFDGLGPAPLLSGISHSTSFLGKQVSVSGG